MWIENKNLDIGSTSQVLWPEPWWCSSRKIIHTTPLDSEMISLKLYIQMFETSLMYFYNFWTDAAVLCTLYCTYMLLVYN